MKKEPKQPLRLEQESGSAEEMERLLTGTFLRFARVQIQQMHMQGQLVGMEGGDAHGDCPSGRLSCGTVHPSVAGG